MENSLPKIDIIIPAYKAQNTLLRTLSSIASQEIVDDVEVTIVNDADGIGYPTEEWMEYERYVHEIEMDEEHILETTVMTFEEWKQSKEKVEE